MSAFDSILGGSGAQSQALYRASLLKKQFEALDKDLAILVAFSGVSLNIEHVSDTVQLTAYLQLVRSAGRAKTPKDKETILKYAEEHYRNFVSHKSDSRKKSTVQTY